MAAGDNRTVEEFTVGIEVTITEYDYEDGTKVYDWTTAGDSSYEWFHTLEEARLDAQNHFG